MKVLRSSVAVVTAAAPGIVRFFGVPMCALYAFALAKLMHMNDITTWFLTISLPTWSAFLAGAALVADGLAATGAAAFFFGASSSLDESESDDESALGAGFLAATTFCLTAWVEARGETRKRRGIACREQQT